MYIANKKNTIRKDYAISGRIIATILKKDYHMGGD